MTETTVKRQVSLLVKGILEANKIDDLKVEIDLISAFHRFAFEVKDPRDAVRIREEIMASLVKGVETENELTSMESRVNKSMGISTDGRDRYSTMLRFLVKKDKDGQPVEKYAEWCKSNPFTAPKFFKIAERPDTVMETWDMAFTEKFEQIRPEHKKVEHVENETAVPNPYKKPAILRKQT